MSHHPDSSSEGVEDNQYGSSKSLWNLHIKYRRSKSIPYTYGIMTNPKFGARLIALDGNIGVGKTTFVKPFAIKNGYHLIEEPVEDNPYLERFYADPGRWTYEMETWFLGERIDAYLKALEFINEGENVIIEGTHHSCLVFTKNCWRNRWITDKQFSEYSQVFHSLNNLLPTPDALLFLEASVDTCHNRMLRRGRECEAGVTKDYLGCIERYMKEMTEDKGD